MICYHWATFESLTIWSKLHSKQIILVCFSSRFTSSCFTQHIIPIYTRYLKVYSKAWIRPIEHLLYKGITQVVLLFSRNCAQNKTYLGLQHAGNLCLRMNKCWIEFRHDPLQLVKRFSHGTLSWLFGHLLLLKSCVNYSSEKWLPGPGFEPTTAVS